MPYIPPHLRPGFVPTEVKKVDYSGRVHWPTNINTHRQNNIIQPARLHSPHRSKGLSNIKYAIKLTRPMSANSMPLSRGKFHTAVKKFTRRKYKTHKTKAKTRKHKKSKKTRG